MYAIEFCVQTNFEPDINSFARDEYVYWEIPVEKPPRQNLCDGFVAVSHCCHKIRASVCDMLFHSIELTLSMLVASRVYYSTITDYLLSLELSSFRITVGLRYVEDVYCAITVHGCEVNSNLSVSVSMSTTWKMN